MSNSKALGGPVVDLILGVFLGLAAITGFWGSQLDGYSLIVDGVFAVLSILLLLRYRKKSNANKLKSLD